MNVIAFADEFGNNSFDFNNQSSHFIIASVLMNTENLETNNEKIEKIRKKYFQTGEIKSNKVKGNHRRRKIILDSLQNIDFQIYAVIVDKTKLYGEGFKYKKSFYKFLNGLLYKELYRTYPQLELKVDEHGGNDFMLSFKKYVQNNHIRNLFSGSDFLIKDSKNELGVQLADFIAGTLGYIFDDTKRSDASNEFLSKIKNKIISLKQFPSINNIEEIDETDAYSEFDKKVAEVSLNRIYDYLDTTIGNTQEKQDRINFLKLLLLYHQSNHHKKYTKADEFLKHLNVNRGKSLGKEAFTSKVVGHLRDKGILISSGRSGYKIPSSVKDLKSFVNHGKTIIIPMLKRIKDCRETILLATMNEYDILEEPEYKKLKEIIENAS